MMNIGADDGQIMGSVLIDSNPVNIEALTRMEIENDPRTQFWIDTNKVLSKWIYQG